MQLRANTVAAVRFNHLDLAFGFADAPGQPLIGICPVGAYVEKVCLEIITPFDQPVLLEVGRLFAPAELMLGADNDSQLAKVYHVLPDLVYAVATDVYLTLTVLGLPPTVGSGRVIVYLN